MENFNRNNLFELVGEIACAITYKDFSEITREYSFMFKIVQQALSNFAVKMIGCRV